MGNDRVRSILVCCRQYRMKVCKLCAIKLNGVLMSVKIRNRVLTEVGGKYESILTLAACERIPGTADQDSCARSGDNDIVASAAIKDRIVPFWTHDCGACGMPPR